MERFRNLDWHPALEDLIDNVFINDERMERESAMYRILTDTFTSPFEDIESEYADVNVELIKKYLHEDGEVSTDTEDEHQQEVGDGGNSSMQQQEKSYVPGIRKLLFRFPRMSRLNKNQQAMCLRVLQRLLKYDKKKLNLIEKKEFDQYMILKEMISEEQKEFLDFVKGQWDETSISFIKCNEFVVQKWNTKMQRFKKLPRYYVESINIPLSVQKTNINTKDIKVTFVSCLQEGSFSNVILPKLDRRHILLIDAATLRTKYPLCAAPDKATQYFKLPVSEDTYCERLAVEAEADFVISSSGLKCLLSNIDPDHSDSWLIPVIVKSHHEKNIVYIDKKLPPASATVPQKNTWVFKYILRHYFINVENESSEKTKHKKEDKKLEKAANYLDSDSNDSSFNDYLKDFEQDLYLSDTDKSEKSLPENLESGKIDESKINEQNVSYKLFKIGSMDLPKHERIKHGVKEYNILVRTKTDGIGKFLKGKRQPLILAPKMEHQLELGAEAVTLEEGLQQWASLKFRPKTSLARVRITADTSEIIQIEEHTPQSLNSELQRLYNIKVEDSLNILYNVIERLSSLTPGQYIMRHVPQNGPFAYVYEHTTESRKNVFDLHTIYQSKFQTILKTPWPRIDTMMTTPALKCFQRMPAMFYPILNHQKFSRPRGRPKKNASSTNKVPVSPRRSVRLRKTNTT